MSLEQALTDNTAAMRELTAILKGGVAVKGDEPAKAAKPEAPKASKPEAVKAEAVAGPSRKDVADAIVSLGKEAGREQALALLAKFDAKNVAAIPDGKLKEAHEAAAAALAAAKQKVAA